MATPATRTSAMPARTQRMFGRSPGWLIVGWVAASLVLWNLPLNNDISWQMWVARQLRHGRTFGTDIAEINPPLWFWEAMPLSALADGLGIAATHAIVVATLARTAIGMALAGALMPREHRITILVGIAAVSLMLPVFSFGERDHLAVIGSLPYAALIATRVQRRPVDVRLALAIGLFAAWGFALKPYFALPPLMLEAWLIWRLKGTWRPIRPETCALVAAAMLYAIAIILFAPGYLAYSVPLARAAYGEFAPPFSQLFTRQAFLPFWIMGAAALLLTPPRTASAQATAVAATAFFASYLIQGKGFPYHAVPTTVALGWTLWLTLCEQGTPFRTVVKRPLAGLALVCAFGTAAAIGTYRAPPLGALDRPIATLPPGTVFVILSAHSWHFPIVEQHGFVWPMPGAITLMPLPAILRDSEHGHAGGRTASLRRTTLDVLARNLTRCTAQAILVDDPAESPILPPGADYLRFVRSDVRLSAILDHYRPIARERGMQLLIRTGPMPATAHCP